jgi:hypothetical protein
MERNRYHQLLFTAAAFWNCGLAVIFGALSRFEPEAFTMVGLQTPLTFLWFDTFLAFIFSLGLGFYLVSRDITQNHGLIQMAIFWKIAVFIVGILHFLAGDASIWVLLIVAIDLLFGILFIEDLMAITKQSLSN